MRLVWLPGRSEWTLPLPSHPLRAALLGTGAVARFHASALKTLEGVELMAAASMSDAESFCQEYQIPHCYGSLDQLLRAERPDVVHLCTPPEGHGATHGRGSVGPTEHSSSPSLGCYPPVADSANRHALHHPALAPATRHPPLDHCARCGPCNRDPQPRVPVGPGVEAVDREAADLVVAGAAPAGDDQRRALVGIGQLLDGGHQRGQLMVGDEPGQRPGRLRDVRADEQHPTGHVVPLPGSPMANTCSPSVLVRTSGVSKARVPGQTRFPRAGRVDGPPRVLDSSWSGLR